MITLTYLLLLVLFALSALLHGITGLGFPMITTGVLTNFYSLETTIVMVLMPALIINLVVLLSRSERGMFAEFFHYLKRYWMLVVSSILGGYFGVKLLFMVDVGYIYLLMSAVIIFYVATSLSGKVWRIPVNGVTLAIFGALAGLVGGSTNAMAPLLMVYLLSTDNDTREIAKASNLCYLAGKIVQFWVLRDLVFAMPLAEFSLLMLITLLSLFFLLLGIRLREKISRRLFTVIILGILFIVGAKAGINGIMLLMA